jgi:hypothetical protein
MASFARFEYTSAGTVYTADSTDVIIGCLISNTHASTTAKVTVTLSGTSLVTGLEIPAGTSVELVQGKLVAVSGDAVALTVTTGSVNMYLSVLDSAS